MVTTFIGTPISRADGETLHRSGVTVNFLDLGFILRGLNVTFRKKVMEVDFPGIDKLLSGALIWYQPGSFELLPDVLSQEPQQSVNGSAFTSRQFAAAADFFETWLTQNCLLLDSPSIQRKWSNKLRQLELIARVFPHSLLETRLTSRPIVTGYEAVVKHIGESRLVDGVESFYAQTATPLVISQLAGGPRIPFMLQERLDSQREYRTYRLGSETVTVSIDRPQDKETVDVHFFPDLLADARVVLSPVPLSFWDRIQEAISLQYFAVDYALREGGCAIFEINPLFSWSWMPPRCLTIFCSALERSFVVANTGVEL